MVFRPIYTYSQSKRFQYACISLDGKEISPRSHVNSTTIYGRNDSSSEILQGADAGRGAAYVRAPERPHRTFAKGLNSIVRTNLVRNNDSPLSFQSDVELCAT
jgi:hypothetical protein